ncbi:MAG: hypothetical protein OXK78_05800 [Caldilineaceae bacterium]|nr:hypothetical protein [Caldilineaceae bacterium]
MVRRKSFLLAIVCFLLALIVVSACAPNPRLQLISPNMVVLAEGETFVPPTPTPRPRIAGLSDEEVLAGLPEEIVALIPGDAERGLDLTVPHNCIGCHVTDNSLVDVAPTWLEIADTAVGRAEQLGLAGPALYLYTSIINPNDYIVDGYTSDVMPETYSEDLSEQDLADLLTYLLAQRAE